MAQNMDSSYAVQNSVNAGANTSNITVYARFTKTAREWAADNPIWKIYVNGSQVATGTYNFNTNKTSGTVTYDIGSWTGDVSNPTGGGSATWSCRFEGNGHPISNEANWYTKNGTLTLSTIRSISYNANGGSSTPSSHNGVEGGTVTLASAISHAAGSTSRTTSISYNSNGGSGSMTATSGTQSGSYPINFSKWALNGTSGTTYNAGASFTVPSSNSTMYATWSNGSTTWSNISLKLASNSFTKSASASRTTSISYNSNGGSGSMTATSGTQTGTTTYPFSKWALGSTSGTQYSAGTSVSISSSTTAYAIWGSGSTSYNNISLTLASNTFTHANGTTSKTVTVSYNSNGGSGTMTASTGTSSGSYPITFSKWALGSTSGTQYTAGTSVSISGNTTAYAIWTNGSTTWANTSIALKSNTFTKSASTSRTVTLAYNSNGGSGTMNSTTGTQTGTTTYPFSKWALDGASGTQYNAGTNLSANSDHTMYAIWGTGSTAYTDKSLTAATNTFTHANGSISKTIIVNYNANGGSGSMSDSTGICSGSYPYSFGGWYENSSGTGPAVTSYTFTTSDNATKTLYAKWNAGSTTYSDTTITIKDNEFTNPGYNFIGWNTQPDGSGTSYSTSYTGQSDLALYAQWESAGSVRYYDGTSMVGPYMPYVWDGTAWVQGIAYVWNGTTWKQGS